MDVTSGSKRSRSKGNWRNCGRGVFVSDKGNPSIMLETVFEQRQQDVCRGSDTANKVRPHSFS